MASGSVSSTLPPPPPAATVKPKSHMKLIAASAVIVIVVVAVFLTYWTFLRPGGGPGSWMFKGAYADFRGQGTMSDQGNTYNLNMSIHEEVLDFNSTHAQLLTSTSMDDGLGTPYTSNTTSWVDLTKNDYTIQGGTLTRTYDTTVTVGNLGTRNCKAYEYSVSGVNMTVYVDNAVEFPIKFSISSTSGTSFNLDLILVSTNIPGLK